MRQRRRWSPGAVVLAAVAVAAVSALLLLVLAIVLAVAVLGGIAYGGYRLVRAASHQRAGGPRRAARAGGRIPAEARGLLEMARTPDPLDRYLLAVREFDRLSAATLAIDPAGLARRGHARRIDDLAEQAYNLHDAVLEIERELGADPSASGALANVWELSVACGELWAYARDLRDGRGAPTLAEVRGFVRRRTALLDRRDALVTRLNAAELRRPTKLTPAAGAPAETA